MCIPHLWSIFQKTNRVVSESENKGNILVTNVTPVPWRREWKHYVRTTDKMGSRLRAQSPSSIYKTSQWTVAGEICIANHTLQSGYEWKCAELTHSSFVLRSWDGVPAISAVVQQSWRRDVTSPFPPSGNKGYIRNPDVPYQTPCSVRQVGNSPV